MMEGADQKQRVSPEAALSVVDYGAESDEFESRQCGDSVSIGTGTTPSRNAIFFPWLPCPLSQPVIPEAAQPLQGERRLEPHEWVELLEQTECLEYISPDVEACMERHQVMGTQELDLSGREFVDSPAIPLAILPPLNGLSAECHDGRMPIEPAQPGDAPRRPGLREKFPRHQASTDHNRVQFSHNYFVTADRALETKGPTTRRSIEKQNAENVPLRNASRSLKFDVAPQSSKPASRRKRASWNGRSTRDTPQAASRRSCKSARKSKDCSIPGCTKGARSKGLCKRHGGGKRCTQAGCTRSDQGGGFCIAHGGGKRCAVEGCKNSAQSRGLCKSHGGGKRCNAEGCTKSTQEGGFCRGHYELFGVIRNTQL